MPQKGAAAPAEAGTATPSAARAETARVRNRDRFMAGLLEGVGGDGRICPTRPPAPWPSICRLDETLAAPPAGADENRGRASLGIPAGRAREPEMGRTA